jgi:hypothetical protein
MRSVLINAQGHNRHFPPLLFLNLNPSNANIVGRREYQNRFPNYEFDFFKKIPSPVKLGFEGFLNRDKVSSL